MTYQILFPNHSIEKKFHQLLSKISPKNQDDIMKEIENLANGPCPYGRKPFKRLNPPVQLYQFTARYRIRIGDFRVLYDVDPARKIVWILALRKRGEGTYKR